MRRHKRSIISGVLVFTLCLGMVQGVNATTIDEAKQQGDELEAQKDAVQAEQAALSAELNQITKDMAEAQENLDKKTEEIKQTEEELVQAQVEENTQYQNMKKRIKFMYEHGDTSYLEIMMASESITEFLNKADYVKQLSEYDRKMLEEFQAIVAEVEAKEAQLKVEYEEISALREDLLAKQGEVEQIMASNQLEIADLEKQIGDNAKLLADLIAKAEEEKRIAAEKAAADAAAAANKNNNSSSSNKPSNKPSNSSGGSSSSGGSTSSGGSSSSGGTTSSSQATAYGTFINPCPGGYVSSRFGYRAWDNSYHKGLDLAAAAGTPTYAADGGRVIRAGWSDSAGNWVVIDHGNGFVTKYMHHSVLYVSTGEYVSRGQQIGGVGTTGYSSGNHLHFQVEKNGVAVDPQLYM